MSLKKLPENRGTMNFDRFFIGDYIFNSSSQAASVVPDGSRGGPQLWK